MFFIHWILHQIRRKFETFCSYKMQSQVFDIWPKYPMYFNNSIASHIYECFSLDLGTNAEKHDISLMINGQDAKSCPICRQREGAIWTWEVNLVEGRSLKQVGVCDLQVHEQVATGAVDVTTMALKKYQYYFKFSWENVKIAQCKIHYRHLFCSKS